MVTIYTENGDSIDIILCGECGATGGGRRGDQRTAVTELWRTFVREKFNSIPFINIKTSPIIFCQNCSALNFLSVIYLISCVMRMSKQHNAAWSILHMMLLYSVLCTSLCELYAGVDIHPQSEVPQKASFYLLSVPLPSLGWSKKLPLCWEYFFRLHKKRKWKHNICMGHSPQPENFITKSNSHILTT